MADPIKAIDVIIQFLQGGDYITYACAAELSTEFMMETKSVKTVGDGVWERKRGQKLSQVVNLSGVIKPDTSTPDAFDLLDYFKNMTDVQFRILFYDENGLQKNLKGNALPTKVNLSAGVEGFATGEITLEVNGDPDYVPPTSPPPPDPNDPDACVAEITAAHTAIVGPPNRRYVYVDSMTVDSATISRWDYSIDGGGTQTKFTDGSIPASWILPLAMNTGTHSITITPICDNGFSGTPYTFTFP